MDSLDALNLAALKSKVNSPAKFSFAYYVAMDRLDLLRRLIAGRFNSSQADFARAIGKPASLVSQWLSTHRRLGDASARHIELKLGLGTGFFDGLKRDDPEDELKPTDDERTMIVLYRTLPEGTQETVRGIIKQIADAMSDSTPALKAAIGIADQAPADKVEKFGAKPRRSHKKQEAKQ